LPKLELSIPVVAACSPEEAFDYFADHRHVAQMLEGVSKWEPIGDQSQGEGARYEVEMVAMGVPLASVLRIDRWRRPHEIGWVSESGLIEQQGGFTFSRVAKGVRIVLHISYVPPASVIGAAVASRIDGFVRKRLANAMERIRETLERRSKG
jgi:uncharacterized membrane protein